jgi:tRNA-binding protein
MQQIDIVAFKPFIPFETLDRVDLRVGKIVAVEDVPTSKKLLKLKVDFGDRVRTIFAGLKPSTADFQSLIGKQSLFVVNLEPKSMLGEISEGMLLDLGFADGITPVFLTPETPVPNGTRAG